MNDYLAYRLKIKNEGKPPAVKKPYKIAQYGKKRQKANRVYAEKSRPLWKGKQCTIKAKGCTRWAEGIHHPKGKSSIELLLDENNMLASCNHCNSFLEQHDAWAREKEFKLSRLKK